MAKILDGKKLSGIFATDLEKKITRLSVKPKLVIIQVGDLEESNAFIRNKILFAKKIGVLVEHKKFDEKVTQAELLSQIKKYNSDKTVHGLLLQLPIPAHLDKNELIETIDYRKDVDGLTSKNIKLLFENKESLVPAAAKGIMTLFDHYKIKLSGKKVTVVGQSALVGRPIALCLLNRKATVTVCHKQTKNLKEETKKADIVIVAAGHRRLINKNFVSKGQIIIDVGINVVPNKDKKKIEGDSHFDEVQKIVKAITPVPGGVGPMTVLSLFENLLMAYEGQTK